MKVCVLFHKFQPGHEGISISIDRLTKNMPEVEFHIVSGKLESKREDVLRTNISTEKTSNKIFVHRVGFLNNINSEEYPDGLDNFCFAIEKLHQEYKFDLIHSYFLTPNGYIGTLVAKKLKIPSLVGVRGNDLGRNHLDYKKLFWIYWTLKNADYLTFLNQDLLDTANSIYPCKRKSRVVMNSSYFPYDYAKKEVNSKEVIFGYWGDVKRKKGIIYLLDAIALLKSQNFKVCILGDIIGDDKEIYSQIIKKHNMSNKVSFVNSIAHDKIAKWVSKIDVFVFPTLNDGCPNVVFEAMFLEKAIISTDIKAISQIVTNKKDAILVPPRDALELAKAMTLIIQEPKLIHKLGTNAKDNLLKKFPVKTEWNEYKKIYINLTKKGK